MRLKKCTEVCATQRREIEEIEATGALLDHNAEVGDEVLVASRGIAGE